MYVNPLEHLVQALTYQPCSICLRAAGPLCSGCFEALTATTGSRCYKCNKLTKANLVCRSCSSRLRRVWWVGPYDDALKPLIHSIKLARNRTLARQIGWHMAGMLPYLPEDTIVSPIPTAAQRVRRRGFDQADLLAQSIARSKGLGYQKLLQRVGSYDQIGKRRHERFAQMRSSFVARDSAQIKARSILLVDDVLTTGATLEAAAARLRMCGAKHVDAVVIARHMLQ